MGHSNTEVNMGTSVEHLANVTLEKRNSLTGGGLVNANGTTSPFNDSSENRSQPITIVDQQIVNWLITPPAFTVISRDEIKVFLVETFKKGIEQLNEVNGSDLDIKSGEETLMETRWFSIGFGDNYKENIINSKSMEGAGQFIERDGLYPLLILLYLQKAYQEIYQSEHKLVKLCDEKGALIEFDYRSIDSIKTTLDRFTIETELFRKFAEPLGMVPIIFNFATMESDKVDMYF